MLFISHSVELVVRSAQLTHHHHHHCCEGRTIECSWTRITLPVLKRMEVLAELRLLVLLLLSMPHIAVTAEELE